MELAVETEEIAAMVDEAVEVFGLVEIQTAGETGEDHAEAEDVRDGIMMTELVFPGNVAGQEDRAGDFFVAFADVEVGVFFGAGIQSKVRL
jgi:hypothetical protein